MSKKKLNKAIKAALPEGQAFDPNGNLIGYLKTLIEIDVAMNGTLAKGAKK